MTDNTMPDLISQREAIAREIILKRLINTIEDMRIADIIAMLTEAMNEMAILCGGELDALNRHPIRGNVFRATGFDNDLQYWRSRVTSAGGNLVSWRDPNLQIQTDDAGPDVAPDIAPDAELDVAPTGAARESDESPWTVTRAFAKEAARNTVESIYKAYHEGKKQASDAAIVREKASINYVLDAIISFHQTLDGHAERQQHMRAYLTTLKEKYNA